MKLISVALILPLYHLCLAYKREESQAILPVIYPSYLYLNSNPKKDVMFKCKVKSKSNISISWSFKNKKLESTKNRRYILLLKDSLFDGWDFL